MSEMKDKVQGDVRINPDVIAWMEIPGTAVSYPVLRSCAEKQEDYYLKHNIYGSYDRHGSLFVQHKYSDPEESLMVVYGHNMRDGTMFHDLHRFRKENFRKKHSRIVVYTEQKTYQYEVVEARLINGGTTEETYRKICRSQGNEGTDRNLMLVTCTDDGMGRLIITAILKEETE